MLARGKPNVKKSARLRELLKSDRPIPLPWGGTALHAQLAESTGFQAFGISGSNVSTNLLGLPDAGLLTMTELVENVRRVCRATSIPVIVDSDTGYGNAVNTIRTAEEIIMAGAAALFLEDQVSPKRCGFVKGKEVVPLDEAIGKLRAVCDCRDELDPDFVVIGRTDVRGCPGGSVEQVVERGRAFLEAGVDIFYAEALQTREEIRFVRDALPDCLFMIIPYSLRPLLSEEEMAEFRICFSNAHFVRAGNIAMDKFLRDFRERGEAAWIEFMEDSGKHHLGNFGIFDLTGFPHVLKLEEKYLPAHTLERYEGSIGTYDPRNRPGSS